MQRHRIRGGSCGALGKKEIPTEFWYQNIKVIDHLKDLGVNGSIILKCVLEVQNGMVWNVFILLRIGTSGV